MEQTNIEEVNHQTNKIKRQTESKLVKLRQIIGAKNVEMAEQIIAAEIKIFFCQKEIFGSQKLGSIFFVSYSLFLLSHFSLF
jgi:hypothetical protein